ncbi:hypothetical protein TRIUR3_20355 [Triticum urartu]|uniref:Oxysterol-binding protein-related protein 1C n=1 Tax=Triticum urartu TaxID=4572 RepID=M7YU24_TRIUA|nr:hypothetical protein TRIUR3_20355 [Triticum urartu]
MAPTQTQQWFAKIDFATYDGTEDPLNWLNQCDQFFRGQRTLASERTWLASYHLRGAAQTWLQTTFRRMPSLPTWPPQLSRRCLTLVDRLEEFRKRFLTLQLEDELFVQAGRAILLPRDGAQPPARPLIAAPSTILPLQPTEQGDSLMRTLLVAAFAVSSYASTEGRQCKPFNPLLGETYEADYPDKGLRFFSEKPNWKEYVKRDLKDWNITKELAMDRVKFESSIERVKSSKLSIYHPTPLLPRYRFACNDEAVNVDPASDGYKTLRRRCYFTAKATVSHHPVVVACHCDGRGWKFWGDSNLRGKFWGRSIQLDPIGVLTLQFDDGEKFQWSKVTTSIYNIIIGKIYCDHYGTMHIKGSSRYSCKLKFKELSIIDRNAHQVQGFVQDNRTGEKVAMLIGKWDEAMYYVLGDPSAKPKWYDPMSEAVLLWERDKSLNQTRYNLSPFAISLNELPLHMLTMLPPTDSRLRPDQRHLENGEYEKANLEKLRLEQLQRQARRLQEKGWQPRWFRKDEDDSYCYLGGYWEAREKGNWDGIPHIFGQSSASTG